MGRGVMSSHSVTVLTMGGAQVGVIALDLLDQLMQSHGFQLQLHVIKKVSPLNPEPPTLTSEPETRKLHLHVIKKVPRTLMSVGVYALKNIKKVPNSLMSVGVYALKKTLKRCPTPLSR